MATATELASASDCIPLGNAGLALGASRTTLPRPQRVANLWDGEKPMIIVVEIASHAGTRACKEYDALPLALL
jgi:hypothetical protein